MKRIILPLLLLLFVGALHAQEDVKSNEVFKLNSIVKGEAVTYQVLRSKRDTMCRLVRNLNNPDTVLKPLPTRGKWAPEQLIDIKMQIAEILLNNLSREELSESWGVFGVVLRVDKERYKLLQVTCFDFLALPSVHPGELLCPFWLNFDPDRLHKIEQEIVEKVVLPERMSETYLTDDFQINILEMDLEGGIEAVRAKRKKAIEYRKTHWEKDNEMFFLGPPREL